MKFQWAFFYLVDTWAHCVRHWHIENRSGNERLSKSNRENDLQWIEKKEKSLTMSLIKPDTTTKLNPTLLMGWLHIGIKDSHFLLEQSQHLPDNLFYKSTVDIDLDIRKYHNWTDLFENPSNIVFHTVPSTDTIDIDKQDNHSCQHDNQADNSTNNEIFSGNSESELNKRKDFPQFFLICFFPSWKFHQGFEANIPLRINLILSWKSISIYFEPAFDMNAFHKQLDNISSLPGNSCRFDIRAER